MPPPVKARVPRLRNSAVAPVAGTRRADGQSASRQVSAGVVRAQSALGNAAVTAALGGTPRADSPPRPGWPDQMSLAEQNLVGNQAVANQATAPPAGLVAAPGAPRPGAKKPPPTPQARRRATAPTAPGPDRKDLAGKETAPAERDGKGAKTKEPATGSRSPGADPKFQALKKDVNTKKKTVGSSHPPATAEAGSAQAAAVAPADDQEARGKAAHAEDMDAAQPKEFDKQAFIDAVKKAIADKAPKNLDEADKFGESGKAEEVKTEVQGKVGEGKDASAQEIADTTAAAPQPAPDAKQVVPMAPDKVPAKPGAPNPNQAAPDVLPPSATDMSAGPQQVNRQMADAQVTEQQLSFDNSREPQFDKAVGEKKTMEAHSSSAPKKLRADESGELKDVKNTAAARGATAMAGIHATRVATGNKVGAGKQGAKTSDEDKRKQVTDLLQEVFDRTKCEVEKTLSELDKTIDNEFTTKEKRARDRFTTEHTEGMDRYKDERYGGAFGWARWTRDLFAGLPDEANRIYERARDNYLKAMDQIITDIADIVERELRRAKDQIATGRRELAAAVDKLPADLKAIGREAAGEFQGKFDELRETVDDKGSELVDTLATKYTDAVKAVDEEIAKEKEKNKGLVAKAAEAIGGAIKAIVELGRLLLGVLRKAATAVGAILKNPIGFLSNLVTGVGGGLRLFMKNAGRHLEAGVLAWLLGTGAAAGLQLPTSFDIIGILMMIAAVLGLTWANIRARLARRVPDQAIVAAETAVPLVAQVKRRGVAGMWDELKARVGDLKKKMIDDLVSYLLPTIILAGITWIVSLFNPASAFIRACKMIIDIIRFIVTNARQIIDFVNAVLDAVIAIARGGTGGVPALVERALARSIPVLIGALAALLGIGGIAGKVREIFQKLARPVNRAIDWVVDKIVGLVKKLWAKLKAAVEKKKRPKKPDRKPARPPRKPAKDRARPPRRRRPDRKRPKARPDRRKPDKRSDKAKKRALDAAVRDALKLLRAEGATPESVDKGLPDIKRRHRLTSIKLKKYGEDDYAVRVAINPAEETSRVELTEKDFPYEIDEAQKGMKVKKTPGAVSQLTATVIPMEGDDRQIGFVVTIATIPSEVKSDMAVRYITTAWEGGTEDLAAARTAVVIGINAMEHLDPDKGKTEIATAIGKVDTRPELNMAVFGFTWTPNWVRVKKGKRSRVGISEVRRKFNKLDGKKKPLAEQREKDLRAKKAYPFGLFREEVLNSSYVRTATRVLKKMNDVVYAVGQDADTAVAAKNTMGVLAAYVKVLDELGQHPLIVIGGYRFGGFKWRRRDARRSRQLTLWSNEVDRAIRAAINKVHPQMLYPTEPNMLIKLLDTRKGAVKGIFQKIRTRALMHVQGGLYGIGEAEGRFLRNQLKRVFGHEFTVHFAPEVSTVTSSAPGNIRRGLEVTAAHAIAARQGMTMAGERVRVAHEAYALILQSQTMASAKNLARELVKADADLMRLPEQIRRDFQGQLQNAFFQHVEDIVLIMVDNPRLAADSREVTKRIRALHRTANKIAQKAVNDSKPKAMVDAIRTAEKVAEQIIESMTAEDLRATWSRLHRLLDIIMSEQNQGGGAGP